MSKPYDQGAPPQYPQSPPPAHYDAGPAGGMQPYQGPAANGYYGEPGPYQQQGQGYPPQGQPGQQQPMYYQQGPPPGTYQRRQKGGASGGLFAGLCAGLACCCCLDCLF